MDQGMGSSKNVVVDPIFSPSALEASDWLAEDESKGSSAQKAHEHNGGVVNKGARAAAIILAGGVGERFGRENGKQIIDIAGKPSLTWSIIAFDEVGDIGQIVVVCPEDRMKEYKECAIDPFDFATPIIMAPSGDLRQESAFSGLEYVSDDYEFVMLHDGARPLIQAETVSHALNCLKGHIDADGVVVGFPAIDTLKIVEDGVIMGTPDRKLFWSAQTPQAFRTGIYRRAHASALSDGFVGTDDSSLIERLGGKVLMVQGKRDNVKLTVPEDFEMLVSSLQFKSDEERED